MNVIKIVMNNDIIKSTYKWWRVDKNLWEEKFIVFWLIPYYRYTIWNDGKIKSHIKIFKYKNPEYIKKSVQTIIYVGKKEFIEKYKGNKFSVPLNYTLDLTIP